MKFLSIATFFSISMCMQLFGEQMPCSEIKKRLRALQGSVYNGYVLVSQKWEDVRVLQKLYEDMEKENISGKFSEKYEVIQELKKLHPDNNPDDNKQGLSKFGGLLLLGGGGLVLWNLNTTAKFCRDLCLETSSDLSLKSPALLIGGTFLMIFGRTITKVKNNNADKELKKNIELITAFVEASK